MTLVVDIWSDVICPWCYVGKRRFESALAEFEHADEVEVRWRSYQLDPSAPQERSGTYTERVARKYGIPEELAAQRMAGLVEAGAEVGLDMRFDLLRAGSTAPAHQLLHHAAAVGRQGELKERLLRATFTEGARIGDPEVLVALAAEVGIDAGEARAVLADRRYADAVAADQEEAVEHEATGVPFYVFDGRVGFSGAQPSQTFLRVLRTAWREGGHDAVVVDGAACEGDACDL